MMPHVTCVCLTADRQAMTDRVVKCFLAQTYTNKSLLILDNGRKPYAHPFANVYNISLIRQEPEGKTIGALRNAANNLATLPLQATDIIAHWDSDDWSHPLRLAWQVRKLTGGEATHHPHLEAVGYRTLLFWRSTDQTAWLFTHERPSYCVGTSLCYWRKAWESNPFRELYPPPGIGEDMLFLNGVKSEGQEGFFHDEPAMIAEIHGANTTIQTIPGDSWKRVPEWDERLKELMKL